MSLLLLIIVLLIVFRRLAASERPQFRLRPVGDRRDHLADPADACC